MHELLTDWRAPLTVYTDLSNGWQLDCLRSGEFKVAWLNFLWGDTSQVWTLTTSVRVKIWEKCYHNCMKDENFSRSGLYYNQSHHCNVMTPLRIFDLSLCFSVSRAFLRNCLREYVPAIIASIMAKFKQILWERLEIFGDKVLRFIKTAK